MDEIDRLLALEKESTDRVWASLQTLPEDLMPSMIRARFLPDAATRQARHVAAVRGRPVADARTAPQSSQPERTVRKHARVTPAAPVRRLRAQTSMETSAAPDRSGNA